MALTCTVGDTNPLAPRMRDPVRKQRVRNPIRDVSAVRAERILGLLRISQNGDRHEKSSRVSRWTLVSKLDPASSAAAMAMLREH